MFKDFGDGGSSTISDSEVALRTISLHNQKELYALAEKNKKYIDPYKLKSMNVKITKTFGVFFENKLVGSIAFWLTEEKETSLSFWIDSDYYRKGITSKALSLATSYMFENMNIDAVIAHVSDDNLASRELLFKQGFTPTYRKLLDLTYGPTKHTIYRLDK
jgi:RimJ/RimL family protein N-acetyltransferase